MSHTIKLAGPWEYNVAEAEVAGAEVAEAEVAGAGGDAVASPARIGSPATSGSGSCDFDELDARLGQFLSRGERRPVVCLRRRFGRPSGLAPATRVWLVVLPAASPQPPISQPPISQPPISQAPVPVALDSVALNGQVLSAEPEVSPRSEFGGVAASGPSAHRFEVTGQLNWRNVIELRMRAAGPPLLTRVGLEIVEPT